MNERPPFNGGLNVILKIPRATYEQTLLFYSDVLGFELIEDSTPPTGEVEKSYYCKFGNVSWHFHQMSGFSKPDIWLQVTTSDLPEARNYLSSLGVVINQSFGYANIGSVETRIADPSGNMLYLSEFLDR
jgi:catechol 2,3-dioxygenase-like lactoylglutathione lyase family enzyme